MRPQAFFFTAFLFASLLCYADASPGRDKPQATGHLQTVGKAKEVDICCGWRFILEDLPRAERPETDDRAWRLLDLPHDWAFEQGYAPDGAQQDKGGYACGGVAWYRKHFFMKAVAGQRVFIDFDAVYMNSEVWLNGHYLGKRPYGYISFSYELSPYLVEGENVLAVRVDNSLEPSARWYHGCGIYGAVKLRREAPLHFVKDGVFVRTQLKGLAAGKADTARVQIGFELSQTADFGRVEAVLRKAGKPVGPKVEIALPQGLLALELPHPQLWSPEDPQLYTLELSLYDKRGRRTDEELITMGFRDLAWSAGQGFFLNGVQTKLRGVCEHLEGGPVGAAWTPDLMEWKLQLLKDMGCNAIRTAHNPQLPMFYDLCDRLGLMVMDEAFDGWGAKAPYDYGARAFDVWWERDLRAMVRRDRNHPCVIMYSVGNETKGPVAASLVAVCHQEDPDRKVTSGHSASEFMDVLGVNGHSEKQKFLHNYVVGSQAFVGTETPHTWQVRGFYRSQTWYRDGYPNKGQDPFAIPDLREKEIFSYDWTSPARRRNVKQVFNSSYDNATVRLTARHNLQFLREKDWYSGHFRWTGFDYLGEAGYVHGGWPFRAFQGGVIDLAGFPKDHYYLYQSQWTRRPMLHILPHWTHPAMEVGEEIPVWVYTNGEEAELFLNGKSLGRQKPGREWDQMQCAWLVPWQAGVLTAVAYSQGVEVCRKSVATASVPVGLKLSTQRLPSAGSLSGGPAGGPAGGNATTLITFQVTDAFGRLFPYADNRLYVHDPRGRLRFLSFENGNPVDTECNAGASQRRAFFGLARLFVQTQGKTGRQEVYVGSIVGDRSLKLSSEVRVALYRLRLSGQVRPALLEAYYTLDGSAPNVSSARYVRPFTVEAGTPVRVAVYKGATRLWEMQDTFGDETALYWGQAGEAPCLTRGLQAEEMTLDNATVTNTKGDNVYGSGYVQIKAPGGSLQWYQEHDGSRARARLRIRYSLAPQGEGKGEVPSEMALYHNGTLISSVVFAPTGSQDRHWQDLDLPFTLQPGANALRLLHLRGPAPAIDEVELRVE